MLMKRKGAPTTTAFFVLGSHFGTVVAGWPAERTVEDQNLFRMQHGVTHDMIRWEFVTDLEDWEASVLRWYAPMTSQLNEVPIDTIVGFAMGWSSLLQCSARQCFGSVTLHQLGMLVLGVFRDLAGQGE